MTAEPFDLDHLHPFAHRAPLPPEHLAEALDSALDEGWRWAEEQDQEHARFRALFTSASTGET